MALRVLTDPAFDPERELVLPAGLPTDPSPAFTARVDIQHRSADRVLLSADLTTSGYVVLVESYDPGWRVVLDGKEAPVLRANVAFRAVAVPAGPPPVEVSFPPPPLLPRAGLPRRAPLPSR